VKINWSAMDGWFEEDEEIFDHPKDPYKRVDVLQSSRHVRVEVNGVIVADTHKPRLLFETGLRVRTYIPKTDCRMDLLRPTELKTTCPYKVSSFSCRYLFLANLLILYDVQGTAEYYSIDLPDGTSAENVVWWYRSPIVESGAIKGFLAFYDEKVDVWVDGEKQSR